MGPINFRDRKLFRMGHRKKMRWTALALIARFVVLAAGELGHPYMTSHPFDVHQRREKA